MITAELPVEPERAAAMPHVELRSISKHFAGARALSDVSAEIERGTVHALVGENGAGKSTLGKIIAGVHGPDRGSMLVNGREAHYASPHRALQDKITIIAQELALLPSRTVQDNVFLGFEPRRLGVVDAREMRRRFASLIDRAGFQLEPDQVVGQLSVAEQQKVEILRALVRGAELIVMDEPTAPLSPPEVAQLMEIVDGLKRDGTTIVYVSHFLEEVLELSDKITVLKDGQLVHTTPSADQTVTSLVSAMLGHEVTHTVPTRRSPAPSSEHPPVLKVEGLRRGAVVNDVSLEINAGEIVGLGGLVGSGRSEVARAIFGIDRPDAGTIQLDGVGLPLGSPRQSVRAGMALLPESRKEQGLILQMPIATNITMAHIEEVSRAGVIQRLGERRVARSMSAKLGVRSLAGNSSVGELSGGNQQKVMFAKWLVREPRVFIIDEPTRGVDVGAKGAIHDLIRSLANEGMAVLVISSEVEELMALADRVLVMRDGAVQAELCDDEISKQAILDAAFAVKDGQLP